MKKYTAAHKGKRIDIIIDTWPEGIKSIFGVCTEQPDRYLISVNDKAPDICRTLGHELAHIFCGHLEQGKDFSAEMEREADRKAFMYYKLWEIGLLNSTPGCKVTLF